MSVNFFLTQVTEHRVFTLSYSPRHCIVIFLKQGLVNLLITVWAVLVILLSQPARAQGLLACTAVLSCANLFEGYLFWSILGFSSRVGDRGRCGPWASASQPSPLSWWLAGRPLSTEERAPHHPAGWRAASQPRLCHGSPQLCDEQLLHQPGVGTDWAVDPCREVPCWGSLSAQEGRFLLFP